MKYPIYICFVLFTLLSSCIKDDQDSPIEVITPTEESVNPTAENIKPEITEVVATEVTTSSAMLTWEASIADGSALKYSVFLENEVLVENIIDKSFLINTLDAITTYQGKVVVLSDKGEASEMEFSFTTADEPSPSAFEITIADIAVSGAMVSWSASTIEDNSDIVYDIYINDILTQENVVGTSYTMEGLSGYTTYTVKVEARSVTGKTTFSENSFITLGTPPTSFPLTIGNQIGWDDLDPHHLQLNWIPPSTEDGSAFAYTIYLDDVSVASNIDSTVDNYVFDDLAEGQSYTVRILAVGENETETEEIISFTTITHAELSDFELQLSFFDSTSANILWTPSVNSEGEPVLYFIYLNGEQISSPFTALGATDHGFTNLTPNTEYTVMVVASTSIGHAEKTIEKEITFTTSYPQHPTLAIEKATYLSERYIEW